MSMPAVSSQWHHEPRHRLQGAGSRRQDLDLCYKQEMIIIYVYTVEKQQNESSFNQEYIYGLLNSTRSTCFYKCVGLLDTIRLCVGLLDTFRLYVSDYQILSDCVCRITRYFRLCVGLIDTIRLDVSDYQILSDCVSDYQILSDSVCRITRYFQTGHVGLLNTFRLYVSDYQILSDSMCRITRYYQIQAPVNLLYVIQAR